MAPQLTVGRYQPYQPMGNYSGSGASPFGVGGPKALPSYYGSTAPYAGTVKKPPALPGAGYTAGQGGLPAKPSEPLPPAITLPPSAMAPTMNMPDYSSMIGGSWEVGAAESAMAEQMAAARAQFQNQLRTSFIDLGYQGAIDKGSGLSDFSKYIDKDTIQKAIDNKFSAYAQIKQQEAKANAINSALLASSGMATSGTATATAADTVSQAEQARYEGLRNFLSGGQTGLSNIANLKAQLAQGVLQARFAAAQRLAAMYPPTPEAPTIPEGPAASAPVAPGAPLGYEPGQGYLPGYGYLPPNPASWWK
jgi:hypothetical protein